MVIVDRDGGVCGDDGDCVDGCGDGGISDYGCGDDIVCVDGCGDGGISDYGCGDDIVCVDGCGDGGISCGGYGNDAVCGNVGVCGAGSRDNGAVVDSLNSGGLCGDGVFVLWWRR